MTKNAVISTNVGAPVVDDQSSMIAGPRGPVALLGNQPIEKPAPRGWGVRGTLAIGGDIARPTKAVCLHRGATTDMTARFPTMGGRFAAAGAEHDVCGFALEF